MADPYTDAEREQAADVLREAYEEARAHDQVAAAVLDAVLPDHDARVRADERARVAEEIRAHADRHAPAGSPLNHPRTVLRRHLLLAGRVAEGPLTDDDLAHIAAQVVGLARQHATPPTTEHRCTDFADWHGGYQCTCGELWLIDANRCMTQPTPPTTEEPTCA